MSSAVQALCVAGRPLPAGHVLRSISRCGDLRHRPHLGRRRRCAGRSPLTHFALSAFLRRQWRPPVFVVTLSHVMAVVLVPCSLGNRLTDAATWCRGRRRRRRRRLRMLLRTTPRRRRSWGWRARRGRRRRMMLARMLLRVMLLLLRPRRLVAERPVGIPWIAFPNPTVRLAAIAGTSKGAPRAPNVVLRLTRPLRDIAVRPSEPPTASHSFVSCTRATGSDAAGAFRRSC